MLSYYCNRCKRYHKNSDISYQHLVFANKQPKLYIKDITYNQFKNIFIGAVKKHKGDICQIGLEIGGIFGQSQYQFNAIWQIIQHNFDQNKWTKSKKDDDWYINPKYIPIFTKKIFPILQKKNLELHGKKITEY